MINHTNTTQKESGVTILISNNIEFRSKNITRYEEGHLKIIKGSILQKEIIILNIYTPNNRPLKHM